jgi:hypothetical protein
MTHRTSNFLEAVLFAVLKGLAFLLILAGSLLIVKAILLS